MFAFNRNVFQPVRPEMQLFIALYRVLMNGPLVEFAAYWAECPDDARNAAVTDFRVMYPELAVRTTGIIVFYPTADDKARYHGPDFPGRKVYEFETCRRIYTDGRDEVLGYVYIAADDMASAQAFVDSHYPRVESEGSTDVTYLVGVISGPAADAMFESGWDR